MQIDDKEYEITRNHRAYEKAALDASYEVALNKLKRGEFRKPLSPRERLAELAEIDPDDPRIEVVGDGRSVMAMLNPPKVSCSFKEDVDDDYQNVRSTIMNKEA